MLHVSTPHTPGIKSKSTLNTQTLSIIKVPGWCIQSSWPASETLCFEAWVTNHESRLNMLHSCANHHKRVAAVKSLATNCSEKLKVKKYWTTYRLLFEARVLLDLERKKVDGWSPSTKCAFTILTYFYGSHIHKRYFRFYCNFVLYSGCFSSCFQCLYVVSIRILFVFPSLTGCCFTDLWPSKMMLEKININRKRPRSTSSVWE